VILFLDDHRGIYIPRDFARSIERGAITGVDPEDFEILEAGPDDDRDLYWEAWDSVCRNAVITDKNGAEFFIYQDGACWLIPKGMEMDDNESWIWPDDETDE